MFVSSIASFVLEVELAPLRRFEKSARGKLTSVAAKTMTMRLRVPFIFLNDALLRCKSFRAFALDVIRAVAGMRAGGVDAAEIAVSIIPIANAAGGAGRCLPSLPPISSPPIGQDSPRDRPKKIHRRSIPITGIRQ